MILVHAYIPSAAQVTAVSEGVPAILSRARTVVCDRWGGMTISYSTGLWKNDSGLVEIEHVELWHVECDEPRVDVYVSDWWRTFLSVLARDLGQTELRMCMMHGDSIVMRVDA